MYVLFFYLNKKQRWYSPLEICTFVYKYKLIYLSINTSYIRIWICDVAYKLKLLHQNYFSLEAEKDTICVEYLPKLYFTELMDFFMHNANSSLTEISPGKSTDISNLLLTFG